MSLTLILFASRTPSLSFRRAVDKAAGVGVRIEHFEIGMRHNPQHLVPCLRGD
jgi:hypothetical protein